jgi:hypothetical protein
MIDTLGVLRPAGQGGARQADFGAGRHRAALRDRYRLIEVISSSSSS